MLARAPRLSLRAATDLRRAASGPPRPATDRGVRAPGPDHVCRWPSRAVPTTAEAQEILHHGGPVGSQHALRMKLHAFDPQLAMSHAHDLALWRARCNLQLCRNRLRFGNQRVI